LADENDDQRRAEEAARRAEEAARRAEEAARQAEEKVRESGEGEKSGETGGPGKDETYGYGRQEDN
jgi:hypothetical protein